MSVLEYITKSDGLILKQTYESLFSKFWKLYKLNYDYSAPTLRFDLLHFAPNSIAPSLTEQILHNS